MGDRRRDAVAYRGRHDAGGHGTGRTHVKPDEQSAAGHMADRHDLIRVHGARVNNLRDVSIEIPKRRLTVFTLSLIHI